MWLFYLFIIYLLIQLIIWISDKRQEKIRDRLANEMFNNNFETTIGNCKNKLVSINITAQQEKRIQIPDWELARLPKYAQKIVKMECPECKNGHLNVDYIYNRFGRVPSSFSCSSKPKCIYKVGLKEAKEKFEVENVECFKKDFNQAYL